MNIEISKKDFEKLVEIALKMAKQPNMATSWPMYCVKKKDSEDGAFRSVYRHSFLYDNAVDYIEDQTRPDLHQIYISSAYDIPDVRFLMNLIFRIVGMENPMPYG